MKGNNFGGESRKSPWAMKGVGHEIKQPVACPRGAAGVGAVV